MSAISNNPEPDIPPKTAPKANITYRKPKGKAPTKAPGSPQIGLIRSNDTESTTRYNPMPNKNMSKTHSLSLARSIASSIRAPSASVNLDINAPVHDIFSTSDPDPSINTHLDIPAHPSFSIKDPLFHPTPSPAPEPVGQSDAAAISLAMAVSDTDRALTIVGNPREPGTPPNLMVVLDMLNHPMQRLKDAFCSRRNHSGVPLDENESKITDHLIQLCTNFIGDLENTQHHLEPVMEQDSPAGTVITKQSHSPSIPNWSESSEPNNTQPYGPNPHAYHSSNLGDIETVKPLAFIANKLHNNPRPTDDLCKDILVQYRPDKYPEWVKLTDDALAPPPPELQESTATPNTIKGPSEPTVTGTDTPTPNPNPNEPLPDSKGKKKSKGKNKKAPSEPDFELDAKLLEERKQAKIIFDSIPVPKQPPTNNSVAPKPNDSPSYASAPTKSVTVAAVTKKSVTKALTANKTTTASHQRPVSFIAKFNPGLPHLWIKQNPSSQLIIRVRLWIASLTISNAYLSSFDFIHNWVADFGLGANSDHAAICFDIQTSGPNIPSSERSIYHTDIANSDNWTGAFGALMSAYTHNFDTTDNIEAAALRLLESMNRATETTMEKVVVHDRKPQAPWWNDDCDAALANVVQGRRAGASFPAQQEATSHLWCCIKTAKRNFFNEVCASATPDNIWSINKWYRGRKTYNIPTLKDGSGLAATDDQKGDLFAHTFFANSSVSVNSTIICKAHCTPE